MHVSSVIPGELPPHPNARETVADSNDEDPDCLREVPPAGDEDGGGGGGEVPIPE